MNSRVFDITNEACLSFLERFNNAEDFVLEFKSNYDRILAYHASNLNDDELNSVKTEGLKLGNKELLLNLAKARFVNGLNTVQENNKIIESINRFFLEVDTPREINFNVSRMELLTNSIHYLKYGSETLVRLSEYLGESVNKPFLSWLETYGKHCIISVEIPVEKAKDYWLKNIYTSVLDNGSFYDYSFVYNYNLPSVNIIDIECFSEI